MTKGGSFKRAVRRQARESGQSYAQTRAKMQPYRDGARTRPPVPRQRAIPELLAHVVLDISRSFTLAAGESHEAPSLLLWANFLRVIPDDGISLTDLPAAARISRRAAKTWLPLEKRGWLSTQPTERGERVVSLTEVGRTARESWAEIVVQVERHWSARLREAERVRGALEEFVGRIELELPHYPMPYGGSDGSALGGPWVRAREGPPRIPAHGTDWVPVVRASAEGVRQLPLFALASQALMAFTIDYEEEAVYPMAITALVAGAMPSTSTPLEALPPALGPDRSGKSGLERYGLIRHDLVRVEGRGSERIATLTDAGLSMRDMHAPIIKRVTTNWYERYGERAVSALARCLAEVDRQLAGDLPDQVLVSFFPGPGTSPSRGFRDVSLDALQRPHQGGRDAD